MGRYYWNSKVAVESCCVIDVARLAREGTLRPGAIGVCSWSRGETPVATISWIAGDTGIAVLYNVTNKQTGHSWDEKYRGSGRSSAGRLWR